MNIDKYKSIVTHWFAKYVKNNMAIYFDSLGVKYTLKGIKKFIGNKTINANIYRMQAYDLMICA